MTDDSPQIGGKGTDDAPGLDRFGNTVLGKWETINRTYHTGVEVQVRIQHFPYSDWEHEREGTNPGDYCEFISIDVEGDDGAVFLSAPEAEQLANLLTEAALIARAYHNPDAWFVSVGHNSGDKDYFNREDN